MGKIIQFPEKEKEEPIYIFEDQDNIGVIDQDDIIFIGIQDGIATIGVNGVGMQFSREMLAKLLWAGAHLMDYEEEFKGNKEDYPTIEMTEIKE